MPESFYQQTHRLRDNAIMVYRRGDTHQQIYQARLKVPGVDGYVIRAHAVALGHCLQPSVSTAPCASGEYASTRMPLERQYLFAMTNGFVIGSVIDVNGGDLL